MATEKPVRKAFDEEAATVYTMDLNMRDHLADLIGSFIEGKLDGIVDETRGGIVGYILTDDGNSYDRVYDITYEMAKQEGWLDSNG